MWGEVQIDNAGRVFAFVVDVEGGDGDAQEQIVVDVDAAQFEKKSEVICGMSWAPMRMRDDCPWAARKKAQCLIGPQVVAR